MTSPTARLHSPAVPISGLSPDACPAGWCDGSPATEGFTARRLIRASERRAHDARNEIGVRDPGEAAVPAESVTRQVGVRIRFEEHELVVRREAVIDAS